MASEALDGFWMDSDGEVILKVEPCGPARCGKVAWLRLPLGPDGQLLLDYRNPDPSLRSRPVCGLEVLTGFKRQEDGTWGDGSVYVSDFGMTFSGYAEVLNPKEVKVTGYLGISLFGQSEVWKRVERPFDICWAKPPKPTAPGSAGAATAPDNKPAPATKAAAPLPAVTANPAAPSAASTRPAAATKEPAATPAEATQQKPADTLVSPGALLPQSLAKP